MAGPPGCSGLLSFAQGSYLGPLAQRALSVYVFLFYCYIMFVLILFLLLLINKKPLLLHNQDAQCMKLLVRHLIQFTI